MIPGFEFATASRILFGAGKRTEIVPAARALGQRPLVVTGASAERTEALWKDLGSGLRFAVPGEPTVDLVRNGAALARDGGCDLVVGIGGGSVIDAAKAIAALAANSGDVFEYLEVVGKGKPLSSNPLPVIAVPTTAGTGAEVTRNSVLASTTHRVKASLRHPLLLPRLAIVDPELTYDLPPRLTASTGLDALTQLIEPYTSLKANPLTSALCAEGIQRSARSLRKAYLNGADYGARNDLSLASLFGGLALANAGLGAVHGFAAPIGGMFPAPHGAVCAVLLPYVMEANWHALRRNGLPHSYDQVAQWLTGRSAATAPDGIAWVRETVASLEIPSLGTYGIDKSVLPSLIEATQSASSFKANPVKLTSAELGQILESAL